MPEPIDVAQRLVYLPEHDVDEALRTRGLRRIIPTPGWAGTAATFDKRAFPRDAWPHAVWLQELTWPQSMYLAYVDAQQGLSSFPPIHALGGLGTGEQAEILTISTDETARGTGLGSLLLRDLISRAWDTGAIEVFLEVRSRDIPVQNFYISHGFEAIGKRKRYYSDDDACVMRMNLAR
ncbi:GNAT family N-acetyltransferase [Arcanobacterium haemolyticum]|nr:GNAT family N-acetyltransferase [Arcanobacterium haemolyticum]